MRGLVPTLTPTRQRRPITGSTILPVPSAPDTPSTPSPADAATAYYTVLSWVSARQSNADVYLDTVNPPVTIVGPKIQSTSYVPTLLPATTYYWKIVAFNAGGSAIGPVWSFTTPAATAVIWSLAGSVVTSRIRFESASIRETLSASPNTASVNFQTTAPTAGQAIKVGLGTLDNAALFFSGEILDVDQTYVGTPDASSLWPVNLIDQTFRLNKRRPFGTWVSTSASTIGRYLVATFAPSDFTSAGILDGLPAVSINFDGSQDFMTCLRALATAISTSSSIGQATVTYAKDVQLFLTNPDTVTPDPIDLTHPPLNDPSPIRFTTDLSQVRTRVYGKGATTTVPTDIAVNETIVPIADATQFTSTGGRAIAGSTSDGAQTQILTYAGVQLSGGGSLVGPGAAPSVAPSLALALGSGLGTGWYGYAVVDRTAAGPSLPGPVATILTNGVAAVTDPSVAPVQTTSWSPDTNSGWGGLTGDSFKWAYTFRRIADGAETALSPVLTFGPTGPLSGLAFGFSTAGLSTPPAGYVRQWYRSTYGGATLKRVPVGTVISVLGAPWYSGTENGGLFLDHEFDANLGATAPGSNGTGPQLQVVVSAIASGASPTTSREVYRTTVQVTQAAALTAQLKLQLAIADNTTTTETDSTADGSLGANVPTSDTSGLTQPSGQVNAGSTSLLLASAGPFQASGGWVTIGAQTVRYTGISTNTLTGIPASGVGAITTTVIYGSQALPAPALTGVNSNNGLTRAIAKGSTVAIWVQRDDTAAQTALGLLELDDNGNPTDGIREYTITDERRSEASLTALCDADLAQFSRPIVSTTYYTRDIKTKAGRTVSINLAVGVFDSMFDPAVFDVYTGWGQTGSFTIQSVTVTFDGPAMYPLRQVQASSVSFTLSDLLRKVVLS